MKELQENKILQPGQEEIRQVPTEKRKLGDFRLPPGVKIWEMITVKDPNDRDQGPVKGLGKDGNFDPELAEIRPARFSGSDGSFQPEIKLAELQLGGVDIDVSGPVNPGVRRRLIIVDGNIYIDAINEKTARRKIIARYFEPNKHAKNETINTQHPGHNKRH